jgi:hypothetical protein
LRQVVCGYHVPGGLYRCCVQLIALGNLLDCVPGLSRIEHDAGSKDLGTRYGCAHGDNDRRGEDFAFHLSSIKLLLLGSFGLKSIPSRFYFVVLVCAFCARGWWNLQVFSRAILMELCGQFVVIFLKSVDLSLMTLTSSQNQH